MRQKRGIKTLIASLLVVVSLAAPLTFLMATAPIPTIDFTGMEIHVLPDDKDGENIQLRLTVAVEHMERAAAAAFYLDYNPAYLTPSAYGSNVALTNVTLGSPAENQFFALDSGLYGLKNGQELVSPFTAGSNGQMYDQALDVASGAHYLRMNLQLRNNLAPVSGTGSTAQYGKLTAGKLGEGETPTEVFFVNCLKEKVALGTLSFRVKPGMLPKIVEKFGKVQSAEDPTISGTPSDYLVKGRLTSGTAKKQGSVTYYPAQGANLLPGVSLDLYSGKAKSIFTYTFPETILSVTPANPQVTVNAYQAFNKGDLSDLALTLQKYSPMVTATYQDGARRNLMMPWGRADAPGFDYGYTVKKSDGTALTPPYDPTGALVAGEGVDYQISQYFYYVPNDAAGKPLVGSDGKPVYQKVATPVTAQMAVTQVKATAVTADSLDMAFSLSGTSAAALATLDALQLPDRARIVTDVVPGGPSLTLPISGWTAARDNQNGSNQISKWPNTGVTPPEKMSLLIADESTVATPRHWVTAEDANRAENVLTERTGTYRFKMAVKPGGTVGATVSKEQIQKAYPWMTADGSYTLPDATRRLVLKESAMAPTLREPTDFEPIAVTTEGATGTVTMEVALATAATGELGTDTTFAVYRPDGIAVPDVKALRNATGRSFTLTFTPTGTDASAEALRRQVNLGGVFWVTVTEKGVTGSRHGAYVAPRPNEYSETRAYHLIGQNAGLYDWPGIQGTKLFLPQGKFEALDANGAPLFVDANGNPTSASTPGATPKLENYGVQTTYDGVVGSQPGVMQNFAVDTWGTSTVLNSVKTYGPADFAATGVYGAYGQVVNAAASKKQVTLRIPEPEKTTGTDAEKLTLSYSKADNIVPDSTLPDKRILATFDTKQEGYAQRQDYTLTLTNSGETDIYGLFVDTTTFQNPAEIIPGQSAIKGGGHFALLKPPATFLPAGASTTFTLTYVYDLKSIGSVMDYRDTLYITSARHDKAVNTGAVPPPTGEDILLKFDAKFSVSASAVHRATVVTVPDTGEMGTAGIVVGKTNKTGNDVIDLTAGSNAFPADTPVYIHVQPKDEYEIVSVEYEGSGVKGALKLYDTSLATADKKIPAGTMVYVLEKMPPCNVVITVTFRESIASKLRLGSLTVYGETANDKLKSSLADTKTPTVVPLWQKAITQKERDAAQAEFNKPAKPGETYQPYTADHVLMQMLDVKAGTPEFSTGSCHYLAVLPATATVVQLEGTLREVLLVAGNAGLTDVSVAMKVFNEAGYAASLKKQTLLNTDTPTGVTNDNPATTPVKEGPTRHLSLNTKPAGGDNSNPTPGNGFPAPAEGKSSYVELTLSATVDGKTESRSYFIELHRSTRETVAVPSAGNSPYGMIENDPKIAKADKDAAKKAFVEAGYRFAGVPEAMLPQYVKNTPLMNAVYSREAWANLGPYEPESGTGLQLYDAKNNLDLNDAALFVIPGEAFWDPGLFSVTDSSGREADLTGAYLTAAVDLLDTAAATQTGRFTLPATDGTAVLQLGPAGCIVPSDWAKKVVTAAIPAVPDAPGRPGTPAVPAVTAPVAIRPGVYELVYHFKDVSSEATESAEKPWLTFKRPLVILSALGDVNASGGAPDAADQTQIISRIGDPLGYTAAPYPGANLFRYRCCDANCDRNINNIDENELKAYMGKLPRIGFYLPTNYRTEAPPAKPAVPTP